MPVEHECEAVALGALLHDLGKLYQRARSKLSDRSQRMGEILCPTASGGYHTHLHVLHTSEFFERFGHWLPAHLKDLGVANIASYHHRPSEYLHELVTVADHLAAGHDRREAEPDRTDHFRKVPLTSIFSRLRLRQAPPAPATHKPAALDEPESVWPRSNEPAQPAVVLDADYARVATRLDDEVRNWPAACDGAVLERVGWLLEAYTSFVVASTQDEPDVSLYDHSTLVAAFAAVLFQYHRRTNTQDRAAVRAVDTEKFLLVSGDLSGIQKYIFAWPTEQHRGIARALRARSFYLALLTDLVSRLLLDRVGLPIVNRVLDAGGRFVLLLDNTPDTRSTVAAVRVEVERWFLDAFAGMLTLNISDGVVCRGKDFIGPPFARTFRRVQRAAHAAKQHKLAAVLQQDGRWQPDRQVFRYHHSAEWLKRQHDRSAAIGKQLPKATHLQICQGESPAGGLLAEPITCCGYTAQLYEAPPAASGSNGVTVCRLELGTQPVASGAPPDVRPSASPDVRSAGGDALIAQLPVRLMRPHVPTLDATARGDLDAVGYKPEADDDEPRERGPLTFNHLAHLARLPDRDGSPVRGHPMIGVLKADVDRLGMLFSDGFGNENVSFGRIAALSRRLDFFFKHVLDEQLRRGHRQYRYVYTVFAGGDDLLLVGPWVAIMHLADDLRAWFARYTATNPNVTLSAGVVLAAPRSPISRLAAEADDAVESAKDAGRNRVAVFGDLLAWSDYHEALQDGRFLDGLMTNTTAEHLTVPRGVPYRLLQYANARRRLDHAEQAGRAPSFADIKWRSQITYDFARNLEPRKPTPGQVKDLDRLRAIAGLTNDPGDYRRLRVAATYALYRNRGG